MLISIIIPTYNYATTLARAIQSTLAQQSLPVEVIIIDDGSTDNTTIVAKSYTEKFHHITYIHQPNKGVASARNHGIRKAKGDYLLFLDADDELSPNAIQNFRQFIAQHPEVDVIIAGYTSVQLNGKQRVNPAKPLTNNPLKNFAGYIHKKLNFSNGAIMFKRHVFTKISYPEYLRSNEDMSVFAHALALFNCQSFPDSVLLVHKHVDSLRNQLLINKKVGFQMMDAIFDANILPTAFMQFRTVFYARRCLSLFRALYLTGDHSAARAFYYQALRAYPRSIFWFSYLKKFILSFSPFAKGKN